MEKRTFRAVSLFLSLIFAISSLFPITAFAVSEGELRSSVISVASGEVGYTGTSTTSKYGDWYGYQGGWCTTFVLWCFNQTGTSYDIKLNGVIVPSGGNCNSMISWFKDKGRYHTASEGYTPSSGDLVFFDWSGNGSCQHVGFVNYISGTTVYTIEGNCSGKVKAREYTSKGSKPYNNISAIMGYASPNYSAVAGEQSQTTASTTKKQTTAKQTTTKKKTTAKQTTTKKKTTEKQTTAKKTTKATTEKTTTQTTTQATTQTITQTTVSTTQEQTSLESLEIYASTYDLQVGDSIVLEYNVKPSNANAVVGYFCDEEGIIELGDGGEIKAIGIGTATVVVCANDDLYNQCSFTVTEARGEVTAVAHETSREVVGTTDNSVVTTEKNVQSVLTRMGVNITALSQNKQLYAIPIAIIGGTFIISIFTLIVKKIKSRKSQ
ncbi:MAG: CHAP domain-containing protein [Eubacterium sp.]